MGGGGEGGRGGGGGEEGGGGGFQLNVTMKLFWKKLVRRCPLEVRSPVCEGSQIISNTKSLVVQVP